MAVVRTAKQLATYADIEALPPNVVGELVAGELFVSPRPAGPHATASTALAMDLGSPFQRGRGGPGGWRFLIEPELHFGNDVLVPDIAGWRRERMPAPPQTVAIELAPDWLCEVLSPSTERLDRTRKLPLYARAGVRHVWLVNPVHRTLEVLRLDAGHWVLATSYGDVDRVRAEPFDAIELDLNVLWSDLATKVPGRAGEAAASYGSLEDDF